MRYDTPLRFAVDHTAEPPSSELHELLTVDEVAALLKVSKSWVYEHTRTRKGACADCLPHIRIGKYLRFDERDLQAYMNTKREEYERPPASGGD